MPYDAPGRRKEVVFPGMGANHAEGIPTNTFAFVDSKVLLLTKTAQLGPYVAPTDPTVAIIAPGETCVGFEGGEHEVAAVGALAAISRGDKLWIDTATQALLTSAGGGTGGANEKQSVKIQGTAGTTKWTVVGEQTGKLKWNASAAEVQLAIEALPAVNPGDVAVSGGPGDEAGTTPYVVEFKGRFLDTDVAAITVDVTELTGGEHKATITTTQAGAPSADTVVPVGVVDLIDATRTPHIARIDCNAWQAFIQS